MRYTRFNWPHHGSGRAILASLGMTAALTLLIGCTFFMPTAHYTISRQDDAFILVDSFSTMNWGDGSDSVRKTVMNTASGTPVIYLWPSQSSAASCLVLHDGILESRPFRSDASGENDTIDIDSIYVDDQPGFVAFGTVYIAGNPQEGLIRFNPLSPLEPTLVVSRSMVTSLNPLLDSRLIAGIRQGPPLATGQQYRYLWANNQDLAILPRANADPTLSGEAAVTYSGAMTTITNAFTDLTADQYPGTFFWNQSSTNLTYFGFSLDGQFSWLLASRYASGAVESELRLIILPDNPAITLPAGRIRQIAGQAGSGVVVIPANDVDTDQIHEFVGFGADGQAFGSCRVIGETVAFLGDYEHEGVDCLAFLSINQLNDASQEKVLYISLFALPLADFTGGY
ncbi:MAG: hypothetical protein A2087_13760 [Spirochaetes bacterium GWD1_61_31]|nr:MAG: hypothetical protein A2Y37_13030 [Spirochaetes bacterium GWB1_60_80]OHD42295.1 MAG: hypothetical protein A2087_13760 [Spirochaetes bacterium GWD1_61_31]HAP44473.1 hypothetical protein [Spirochaetaceae bacterium]HAW86605.1 hypothetical protein [Spirochaetaceae bacterium]HAX36405.1 hypothetical protein [Spirochaetaceae bacterium]